MDESSARSEVDKFIASVMGIDTGLELFVPSLRHDDLLRVEQWLVDNRVQYTVFYIPDPQHPIFQVMLGWEVFETLICVMHPDRRIAFLTAFCLIHGDPGFTRCYSIEWWSSEEEEG